MDKVVNIHIAKTTLSKRIAAVEQGETIIIARAGKPDLDGAGFRRSSAGRHAEGLLRRIRLKLLLNSHILLWWADGSPQLRTRAQRELSDAAGPIESGFFFQGSGLRWNRAALHCSMFHSRMRRWLEIFRCITATPLIGC